MSCSRDTSRPKGIHPSVYVSDPSSFWFRSNVVSWRTRAADGSVLRIGQILQLLVHGDVDQIATRGRRDPHGGPSADGLERGLGPLKPVGRIFPPGLQHRGAPRGKCLHSAFEQDVADLAHAFFALDREIVVDRVADLIPQHVAVGDVDQHRVLKTWRCGRAWPDQRTMRKPTAAREAGRQNGKDQPSVCPSSASKIRKGNQETETATVHATVAVVSPEGHPAARSVRLDRRAVSSYWSARAGAIRRTSRPWASRITNSSGIWPKAWVEHDRHGS